MSDALAALAQRLGRPKTSLSGLDGVSAEELALLHALIDAASERERVRVQSYLRRGIFWPLRWLLQRRRALLDAPPVLPDSAQQAVSRHDARWRQ